ncbi:hypothetical protein AMTRI_Chr08g162830 [Amborella trichopoda]
MPFCLINAPTIFMCLPFCLINAPTIFMCLPFCLINALAIFFINAVIMGLDPFGHDPYKSGYAEDNDFFETYKGLKEDGDVIDRYHLKDGLLFNNGKSCVPKDSRLKLIQEAHRSPLVRHFGTHKMVADANRI